MPTVFSDPLDPDEVDVFTFDWVNLLGAETIAGHTVTPPAALTLVASDVSGTAVRAKLDANGAAAGKYDVLYRIVTSGGRELEETARITVKAR